MHMLFLPAVFAFFCAFSRVFPLAFQVSAVVLCFPFFRLVFVIIPPAVSVMFSAARRCVSHHVLRPSGRVIFAAICPLFLYRPRRSQGCYCYFQICCLAVYFPDAHLGYLLVIRPGYAVQAVYCLQDVVSVRLLHVWSSYQRLPLLAAVRLRRFKDCQHLYAYRSACYFFVFACCIIGIPNPCLIIVCFLRRVGMSPPVHNEKAGPGLSDRFPADSEGERMRLRFGHRMQTFQCLFHTSYYMHFFQRVNAFPAFFAIFAGFFILYAAL